MKFKDIALLCLVMFFAVMAVKNYYDFKDVEAELVYSKVAEQAAKERMVLHMIKAKEFEDTAVFHKRRADSILLVKNKQKEKADKYKSLYENEKKNRIVFHTDAQRDSVLQKLYPDSTRRDSTKRAATIEVEVLDNLTNDAIDKVSCDSAFVEQVKLNDVQEDLIKEKDEQIEADESANKELKDALAESQAANKEADERSDKLEKKLKKQKFITKIATGIGVAVGVLVAIIAGWIVAE